MRPLVTFLALPTNIYISHIQQKMLGTRICVCTLILQPHTPIKRQKYNIKTSILKCIILYQMLC